MGNFSDLVVEGYWKTVPHNTLGLVDIHVGGNLDFDIAHDIETPLAEHMVAVHNEWWDKRVWLSYQNNLALSGWYDHLDDDRDGW